MKLPNEIGPIHFVGIGGIRMSGIVEVLLNLGHKVVFDASTETLPDCSARPTARRGCCRNDAGAVVRSSQGTSIARGPWRS